MGEKFRVKFSRDGGEERGVLRTYDSNGKPFMEVGVTTYDDDPDYGKVFLGIEDLGAEDGYGVIILSRRETRELIRMLSSALERSPS